MNRKLGLTAFLLTAVPVHWAMAQADGAATETTPSAYEKEKQAQELRGLQLANEKLAQENRAAKAKAIADAMPASPTSGTSTVKDNAGKAESAALAAAAVNGVADDIAIEAIRAARTSKEEAERAAAAETAKRAAAVADAVAAGREPPREPCALLPSLTIAPRPKGELPPILLISAEANLGFSHWEQFRFRACHLGDRFGDAIKDAEALVEAPDRTAEAAAGPATLLLVEAGLAVASKLLQWLTPDWEIGTIGLTTTNRALMAGVARAYIQEAKGSKGQVYWQGQISKSGGSDRVFTALGLLDGLDRHAGELAGKLEPKAEKAKKNLDAVLKKESSTEDEKTAAKAAFDKWNNPLTALTNARSGFDQLLKHLNGKEGEALLPINQVIDEVAAAELLGQDGLALSLAVESTGGGYYTRKVAWDIFGGAPPFFVSGGTVVSYAAIRPRDQQVLAAGLFSCNSDYVRINRVAATTNGSAPTACGPVNPNGAAGNQRTARESGGSIPAGRRK